MISIKECLIEGVGGRAPWDGLDLAPCQGSSCIEEKCSTNRKAGGNNLQAGNLETSQLLFLEKHGDYFLNNFIVSVQ